MDTNVIKVLEYPFGTFIEMLKCDEKFLYGLLTLSQEQVSPASLGARSKTSPHPFEVAGGFAPPRDV
jgi:hypothetical protein